MEIGINSHEIPGFTSLLQTHLMRGSLKGFVQLAIGHSQRGNPWPAIGHGLRGDPCIFFRTRHWSKSCDHGLNTSPRNNPLDWSDGVFQ